MNHPEDLTRKPLLRDEITETLRAFIDRPMRILLPARYVERESLRRFDRKP